MDLSQRTQFYQYLLYFFENFVSVEEPAIKSSFQVPTTQKSIFILSKSAGVLYEGAFFLLVSLKLILLQLLETVSIRMCHVLWEKFCCSCMYTKIARNKSQLVKETTWVVIFYVADWPVSTMLGRLDFQCFVGIYLCAFNTFPG